MKLLIAFILALVTVVTGAAQQPPLLRQSLTTNTAANPSAAGQTPVWNGTTWTMLSTNATGGGANENLWTNAVGTYQPVSVPADSFQFRTNVTRGIYQLSLDETNPVLWHVTAEHLLALGADALKLNADGTFNAALGESALAANLSGSQNTAVGPMAMAAATNAWRNVSVGYNSLLLHQTGDQNTAVGAEALEQSTTGARNTAIGRDSLEALTTGADNTAVGYQSGGGIGLIDGIKNVFVGTTAGVADTASSSNVVIGHGTSANNGDVVVGHLAGASLDFASYFNVLVGAEADTGAFGNTNTIGLGWRAKPSADNEAVLGSNVTHYVFRNLRYEFPSSQPATTAILHDDGAGVLSWSTNVTISGTTNQIFFGATNTVPATTASPAKWVSVRITGETNSYKLPLYQ